MLKSTALIVLFAVPLAAQQEPRAVRAAAATITAADVERRLWIIANDSMGGRDTPSDGLNKTAQYIADEFRRFGLKPGGENGTYFQWYTVERHRFDAAGSTVTATRPGGRIQVDLARDAIMLSGVAPSSPFGGEAVVVGPAVTGESVSADQVRGKVVLLVSDFTRAQPPTTLGLTIALREAGALAILRVSNRDSAQTVVVRRIFGWKAERTVVAGPLLAPMIEVKDAFLDGTGLDLAAIRSGPPTIAPVPGLRIDINVADQAIEHGTAPNTIGILEGSDPTLKAEYIAFSAHMDHLGVAGHGSRQCTAVGADSICNGADDDGSGTTGVLEVAEAFAQRGVRPRRSMIFMAVSGEEKGLWGSAYFTAHPTVPLKDVVADFNVDMIGRNWEDTVVAIGRQHSNLGQVLDATAARHPELHMVPVDDRWPEENYYRRSDHFNFAREGVPVLFFFSGGHADYHEVSDEVPKIGFAKEARILRLLFYTSYAVAQDPARPQWTPESWNEIVTPEAKAARAAH